MILHNLEKQKLIQPPKFLCDNCVYLTIMGSQAYGVPSSNSDIDLYGLAIPPKNDIWPVGDIPGFGRQKQRFEQFQQHHIKTLDGKKQYDITVMSIIKYFNLFMENNPNCVDAMFTPRECIVHSTRISELIRDNRKLFLHKGLWHKFRGYSYSQLTKMGSTKREGNRKETYEAYRYDLKHAFHLIRLLNECEQLLTTGDLDLRQNNEQLKAIRRGEWTEQQVREYFTLKEKQLEDLYHSSTVLPYSPDEAKIKKLLLECLEMHYGSISEAIRLDIDPTIKLLEIADSIFELKGLLERYYEDNRTTSIIDNTVEG